MCDELCLYILHICKKKCLFVACCCFFESKIFCFSCHKKQNTKKIFDLSKMISFFSCSHIHLIREFFFSITSFYLVTFFSVYLNWIATRTFRVLCACIQHMWPTIFKIWNQSLPIYKCFCIMKIFNNSSKFLFPYNYWEINSCQKYLFSSHTYTHIYSPTTVHTNVFILISSIKKKQKVCVLWLCVYEEIILIIQNIGHDVDLNAQQN